MSAFVRGDWWCEIGQPDIPIYPWKSVPDRYRELRDMMPFVIEVPEGFAGFKALERQYVMVKMTEDGWSERIVSPAELNDSTS